MVETFWPTVGTVLVAGSGWSGRYRDLMEERRVVLPALSKPSKRMEYSVEVKGQHSRPEFLGGWTHLLYSWHRGRRISLGDTLLVWNSHNHDCDFSIATQSMS